MMMIIILFFGGGGHQIAFSTNKEKIHLTRELGGPNMSLKELQGEDPRQHEHNVHKLWLLSKYQFKMRTHKLD